MSVVLRYLILFIFPCFLIGKCFPLSAQEANGEKISNTTQISAEDSRKFDYFFYEGLNLKASGKYDAAYEAFNHCLSIDSTASAVLYELSSFYAQMNRPEKSLEMLNICIIKVNIYLVFNVMKTVLKYLNYRSVSLIRLQMLNLKKCFMITYRLN